MIKNSSILIIAEAGVNHNGSIDMAKKMIDVASSCGADFVKFQTFKADSLLTKYAKKADYQKRLTANNESHYEMIKKLEIDKKSHFELMDYCYNKKIKFLSTAFDLESIDLLIEMNVPLFKIPSGEITNLPYLRKIGSTKKPIILSTGMATVDEINDAIFELISSGADKSKITILHCNSQYPAPINEVNLNAMVSLGKKFKVNYGYSDHTLGIDIPIACAALGASVIEKHFTLDKKMQGPDHLASLEPYELKNMIDSVRRIEASMGDGIKRVTDGEKKNKIVSRKSIVAKKKILSGDVYTTENITAKRPGNGISPMRWDEIIGTKSRFNFDLDELIKL